MPTAYYFPLLSNFLNDALSRAILAAVKPRRMCDVRVCAYCVAVLTRRGASFHARPVTTAHGTLCTRCGIAA